MLERVAQIHAKILDEQETIENFIHGISGLTHPMAIQTRSEWQEELDKILDDKEKFLELSGSDPIEAIREFHEYLFPNQLEVKHELQSL